MPLGANYGSRYALLQRGYDGDDTRQYVSITTYNGTVVVVHFNRVRGQPSQFKSNGHPKRVVQRQIAVLLLRCLQVYPIRTKLEGGPVNDLRLASRSLGRGCNVQRCLASALSGVYPDVHQGRVPNVAAGTICTLFTPGRGSLYSNLSRLVIEVVGLSGVLPYCTPDTKEIVQTVLVTAGPFQVVCLGNENPTHVVDKGVRGGLDATHVGDVGWFLGLLREYYQNVGFHGHQVSKRGVRANGKATRSTRTHVYHQDQVGER